LEQGLYGVKIFLSLAAGSSPPFSISIECDYPVIRIENILWSPVVSFPFIELNEPIKPKWLVLLAGGR